MTRAEKLRRTKLEISAEFNCKFSPQQVRLSLNRPISLPACVSGAIACNGSYDELQSLAMTVLTCVYCSSPYSPSSRPIPDCLKPPKGARVSSTL